MPRPHIEFIQSQVLPWEKGLYGGARPDVESKILSLDDGSGASSTLIRYPAGWTRTAAEHLVAEEEFFVLDGAIEIGGLEYGIHCYANLPAGYVRPSASSRDGAVVLTYFSATPRAERGEPAAGSFDDGLLVERIDTLEMPWSDKPLGHDPEPDLGYVPGTKILKHDPRNGDWTFLWTSPPQIFPKGWAGKQDTHPCVEEGYLLAGKVAGDLGIRQAGAYFWRPPGVPHGPYGTLTGSMSLLRSKEGPLIPVWPDELVEFSFSPPHRPILPPELEKYREPVEVAGCY